MKPEDAARADFVRISSDPHSTERSIVLLRHLADALASRSIDLAADRLEGTASKTGPIAIDDEPYLADIRRLRQAMGAGAVSYVARRVAPDKREAAKRRWQRKLAAE